MTMELTDITPGVLFPITIMLFIIIIVRLLKPDIDDCESDSDTRVNIDQVIDGIHTAVQGAYKKGFADGRAAGTRVLVSDSDWEGLIHPCPECRTSTRVYVAHKKARMRLHCACGRGEELAYVLSLPTAIIDWNKTVAP